MFIIIVVLFISTTLIGCASIFTSDIYPLIVLAAGIADPRSVPVFTTVADMARANQCLSSGACIQETPNPTESQESNLDNPSSSPYDPNSSISPYGTVNLFNQSNTTLPLGYKPNEPTNPYATKTPQGNYLGNLSSSPYNLNSIANPYGVSNPYNAPNSINTIYGYNSNPSTNPYATQSQAPQYGGPLGRFNPNNPLSEYRSPTGRYNPNNPLSEYSSPTGSMNPNNPLSDLTSPTGRYNPNNPLGEITSPTGRLNPNNPLSDVTSPTGRFNPNNPLSEGIHPYYYQKRDYR